MRKTTDSFSEIRQRKRKRRWQLVSLVVFLLIYFLFLGGILLVLHSPFFQIDKIEVNGNQQVSRDEVLSVVESRIFDDSFWKKVAGFKNILIWPAAVPQSYLSKFLPILKDLSITKDYGRRTVIISVEERKPFGIWCLSQNQKDAGQTQQDIVGNGTSSSQQTPFSIPGSCWWFDDQGIIFQPAFPAAGSLLTVVDDYSQNNLGPGSSVLPEEFIPNLFSVFRVLAETNLGIEEIRLNDLSLQELEVDTYSGSLAGPKLYFSLRFPADDDLAVIQSLQGSADFSKLNYVDFRTQDRAYYK